MNADRPGQSPYEAPQVESILREIRDLIESARPMPLSTSVMINQAEVLDLVSEATERLPEELRAAKWLLKQREEFLGRTRREAEELLDDAREHAEAMVRDTEVVKASESRARSVVDSADAESRRLKLEAEDFCDQRLASFEIVLERTMKVVNAGRAKLQGNSGRDDVDDDGGPDRSPPRGGDPYRDTGQHREAAPHPDLGLNHEFSAERPRLEAVPDHHRPTFFNQDSF